MTDSVKIKEKMLAAGIPAFAVICALSACMPVYAATKKKITSVKVDITANIQPETRYGEEDIEIDVGNGHYSYDYYEIENDGFEWSVDEVPVITIYLSASEDYYFSLTKASAVKLTGAAYVKATKEDSSQTLALQVQLDPMEEQVADLENVTLTDSGYVYWDEAMGAGSYDLRVYRNGNIVGTTEISVEGTEYNLKDYMNRAGTYSVKIRGCNKIKPENKSEWFDTESVTISSERANEIRNGISFSRPLNGEWMKDETGWWYQMEDGSYTTEGWQYIDDKWYFFNENGYMLTGWVEWNGVEYYCNEKTGALLTNTVTPDGYFLDENGSKKND